MHNTTNSNVSRRLLGFCGSLLIYGAAYTPAAPAAATPTLEAIRTVENNDLFNEEFYKEGDPHFPGIGFPPGANTALALDQPRGAATVYIAAPPTHKPLKEAAFTPIEISDPINIAFDSQSQNAKGYNKFRLFLLDADIGELICVMGGTKNLMNPQSVKRYKVNNFGIADPEGMAIDSDNERLFILDAAASRIVAVKSYLPQDFSEAELTSIDLPKGLGELHGLAFNPVNKHFLVLNTAMGILYEIAPNGDLIGSIDLKPLKIADVKSMAIAPSLDQTDSPLINHLYLVMPDGAKSKITEWTLPNPF